MKILIALMDFRTEGGAENDVLNLSRGLLHSGHTVIVASGGGDLVKELDREIKHYLIHMNSRSLGKMKKASKVLRGIIETEDVDIVNPQGIFPTLTTYLALRDGNSRKVPSVTTIHMLSRKNYLYYKMGAALLDRVSTSIIFESECELSRLKSHGLKLRAVTVIPNGVDFAKFDKSMPYDADFRASLGLNSNDFAFAVVARLSPEKGHIYLLQALQFLRRKVPGKIKLLLVGDGPLRKMLESYVYQYDLSEDVIFSGRRRDIPKILRHIDAFILPSLVESFPLSLREAMAMAKPIIATDVGGVREAIIHMKTGILIPSEDPQSLLRAMEYCIQNKASIEAMSRESYELCRQRFGLSKWVSDTIKHFERISNLQPTMA